MSPQKFKYQNKVLNWPTDAKFSENIIPAGALPIWTDNEQCISCWQMTWRERISALLFGRAWIAVLSGGTQPPISATIAKEYLRDAKI